MAVSNRWYDPYLFSALLYEKMKRINAGIDELELYEFRYALDNLCPKQGGWASVELDEKEAIERQVNSGGFYARIQLRPVVDGTIVLDEAIVRLTNMLFVGLVRGEYSEEWIRQLFYFDVRGFFFLHRTVYFTDRVLAHLGGTPYKRFEPRQQQFERAQAIGYREFKQANEETDQAFIESSQKLIAAKGTPIILGVAGPTAAGKTEIVERLRVGLERAGTTVASIEMDNFLTDRDEREQKGIHSLGKEAIHFDLFRKCLDDIRNRRRISSPRYDFVRATSSHDLTGTLKAGCAPLEIEPADAVIIEGNFPFLVEEAAPFIGLKVVYLTDDAVRLKRKWKRDIDYRKKYEPTYFRNRYFRNQFLMAQKCYVPQMEACDMVVDTTGAAIWVTCEIAEILSLV